MPIDTALLQGLEWRSIGPHRGGRVVAVAGDPVDAGTFYFGGCAGGVWKTTDGGTYWQNVSDGFFATAAVGAIAVSESDPNVVYAGTGEACIRGNVSHGDGVYKSTDGGGTWTNVGLRDTRHIGRIRIDPHDPERVYVAALGHAFGPNAERGVFRSTNGGQSWEKVLYRGEDAGAVDLSLDPHNPRVLYAAFWEARRSPWSLVSGGPGSGIFKSTDGGDTWSDLSHNEGLPRGVLGRIGIAVSPAQSGRVYAVVEAEDGAIFRSDDGGGTWQRMSGQSDLRRRAWYYDHIFADPRDADTVWVLNLQCWRSIDGGASFTDVPTPHGDNHDLWIDPTNPLRLIEGNDGGACVSFNGGMSWSTIYNQPTAQFYHVLADEQTPYRVYGSQQDNSAMSVPSFSHLGAITESEWFVPGGGESGYIAVKPSDPNIIVGGSVGSGAGDGRMTMYDRRTGQVRIITVRPDISGAGVGAKDLKYRFQWTFPIHYSRWDANVLYAAGNRLFRSTDDGGSFEAISPDLTRQDTAKLEASGGPITKDNTGAEYFCTIFAFAESPHERGVCWAGSDDGLVHISRDGGHTWEDVTPRDLPEWATINIIEPSPHEPSVAYLAAHRYRLDDYRPYLYKTTNYGKSWQAISAGIRENDFARTIREDPERRGLLFAGTETGLYVSFDDGAAWQPMQGNLPVVPVHDLIVKSSDLIVASHGRSFWILDDISPLRQLRDVATPTAQLIVPRTTIRFKSYGQGGGRGPSLGKKNFRRSGPLTVTYIPKRRPTGEITEEWLDAGKNPPQGVVTYYYLPAKPSGPITLTYLDERGEVIESFSSATPPRERATMPAVAEGEDAEGADEADEVEQPKQHLTAEVGLNRFIWNMRYPDALKLPGDPSTENSLAGPVAAPGAYRVRLSVDSETREQSFAIVPDPRVTASQGELEAQFALLLRIRDKLSEAHRAVIELRALRGQAEAWIGRTRKDAGAREVTEAARALRRSLTEVEEDLVQVKADSPLGPAAKPNSRLATLTGFVDNADAAPTRQAQEVFDDLAAQIDAQIQRLAQIRERDVPRLNDLIRAAGIAAIGSTPAPVAR